MSKYTEADLKKKLEKNSDYEYGFETTLDYEDFPLGLNEDIVREISKRKNEPEWMTNWRLESFKVWQKMEEPTWANIHYEKPKLQEIQFYAAPKKKKELTIWQRRFWEHCIRDEIDFVHHVDYIHYNPVKHGLVSAPKDWEYSSFHRYVMDGIYDVEWGADREIIFDATVGYE